LSVTGVTTRHWCNIYGRYTSDCYTSDISWDNSLKFQTTTYSVMSICETKRIRLERCYRLLTNDIIHRNLVQQLKHQWHTIK